MDAVVINKTEGLDKIRMFTPTLSLLHWHQFSFKCSDSYKQFWNTTILLATSSRLVHLLGLVYLAPDRATLRGSPLPQISGPSALPDPTSIWLVSSDSYVHTTPQSTVWLPDKWYTYGYIHYNIPCEANT